jgi:hypothetical protein
MNHHVHCPIYLERTLVRPSGFIAIFEEMTRLHMRLLDAHEVEMTLGCGSRLPRLLQPGVGTCPLLIHFGV